MILVILIIALGWILRRSGPITEECNSFLKKLLFAGKAAASFTGGKYSPFLFTGFEYGMFAIAVFTTAYGADSAAYIAILDLGHELFIWFVFVTVLLAVSSAKNTAVETIRSFIKSPIILAILLYCTAAVYNTSLYCR